VPSFLSDDWIEDLRRLGGELPKVKGASISCQYEISGTPEGKIRFYTIWEDGVLCKVDTGKLDNPDCVIQAKYEHALDILHGRNKAEAAFMQGYLKVDGDYKKLLVDLHEWRGSAEYRKLWGDLRPS
tara:strand:- start:1469 stop:1849 length:381 start_codon:yes stop_codon:yes gene_type:complete